MNVPVFATAANDKKSRAKENENLFTVLEVFLRLPRGRRQTVTGCTPARGVRQRMAGGMIKSVRVGKVLTLKLKSVNRNPSIKRMAGP